MSLVFLCPLSSSPDSKLLEGGREGGKEGERDEEEREGEGRGGEG